MKNREFILKEIAALDDETLAQMWEDMHHNDPGKYPIKSYCQCCLEAHGGDCPHEDAGCDYDISGWMNKETIKNAEAVCL